jgi:hypothetical protein
LIFIVLVAVFVGLVLILNQSFLITSTGINKNSSIGEFASIQIRQLTIIKSASTIIAGNRYFLAFESCLRA